MTNQKEWLDVLLVVEDDGFFSRSRSGAVWGTVYFQIDDGRFFPQRGWTDLVVAFVAVWLDGLLRVTGGISKNERVAFFDGPFAINISMPQKGCVNLSFERNEKSEMSKDVEAKQLLAHADSAAKELLSKCQHKGWENSDTAALARLIEQIRY
jgi:hypothetical protein